MYFPICSHDFLWLPRFMALFCWLVVYLPLWKMMDFVSWDDEIPNIWKVIKIMLQTTNQLLILNGISWDDCVKIMGWLMRCLWDIIPITEIAMDMCWSCGCHLRAIHRLMQSIHSHVPYPNATTMAIYKWITYSQCGCIMIYHSYIEWSKTIYSWFTPYDYHFIGI